MDGNSLAKKLKMGQVSFPHYMQNKRVPAKALRSTKRFVSPRVRLDEKDPAAMMNIQSYAPINDKKQNEIRAAVVPNAALLYTQTNSKE